MTKSNNNQISDIINNIYNLIINPETTENERELLVMFKNEIEVGKKDNDELRRNYVELFQSSSSHGKTFKGKNH
ncbi:MAG: bacteriocin immunity protein [Streptococcus salivarius]